MIQSSKAFTTLYPVRLFCLTAAIFSLWAMPVLPAAADTLAPADPKTYLADITGALEKSWPTNHLVNIVCHGHSVVAGYFKTPEVHLLQAYPALLRRDLANLFPHAVLNVIVTAIGGENAEQGAARFDRYVISLHPAVVTIDYALNDRHIGLARAEKAWRSMIEAAQTNSIKIILFTPTADLSAHWDDPNDPLNLHAAQIRRLAAEYHTGLVDSLALFQNYVHRGGRLPDLMAQVNHPNAAGHELVAAELLKWFPVKF